MYSKNEKKNPFSIAFDKKRIFFQKQIQPKAIKI